MRSGRPNLTTEAFSTAPRRRRENVTLSIMNAYLQVLYAEEQVANSRNQADATREELGLAKERYGLGAIANSDYLQVKTQLAAEELTLANAVNSLKMAKVTLMQLMEYPVDDLFEIARPDMDAIISAIPASDAVTVYGEALQVKPQIRNAEINRESAEVDLELAKGGFYPSVSMNAGLSTGFTQAAEMGSQLKSGFSPSVGLSVSIPIFRNNQNKSAVAQGQVWNKQQPNSMSSTQRTSCAKRLNRRSLMHSRQSSVTRLHSTSTSFTGVVQCG